MTSITRIDQYRTLDYKYDPYCIFDYETLNIIDVPGGDQSVARAFARGTREAMTVSQAIDIRDALLQMKQTIMENPC